MQQPTFYPIQLKSGEVIELPRVTHILHQINQQEFVGKRIFYGNGQRALHGTQADDMICRIINGEQILKDEWNTTHEKVKNAVRAYLRWQQATGFKPRSTHMIVYSLKHGIAGELDITGLIKNQMNLVEIKTGVLHPELHLMQLVVYMMCYMEMYPTRTITELRLVRFDMDTGNFNQVVISKAEARKIFDLFLYHKNMIMEWSGNYKHSIMTTAQSKLKEAVMVSQTQALEKYKDSNKLTESQAKEIIASLWPNAPDTEKFKAMCLCRDFGLNPLMKHIHLIPFKNKEGGKDWAIIIGIDAKRMIAKRAGSFEYVDDTPRVMSDAEQMKVFGHVKSNKVQAICKLRDRFGNGAVGYGAWPKDSQPYGADKGNSQENMAFIRAESQALSRLSPGRVPTDIQVMDESYIGDEPITEIEGEIIEQNGGDSSAEMPSEGTETPTEAIAESTAPTLPLGGKLGDMLLTCWLHGVDWKWKEDKYHRRSHRQGDGWCQFRSLIKPTIERILQITGETIDDMNSLSKTMFEGKTQSQISEEQLVQLLDAYYQEHPGMFDKPEQVKMEV